MEIAPRKKIYVHYSGKKLPSDSEELTKIIWVQSDTTVGEVLRDFVASAGFTTNPSTLAFLSASGELLTTGLVYDKVDHKDDCVVQDIVVSGAKKNAQASPSSVSTSKTFSLTEVDNFIKNRQFRKAKLACEEILKGSSSEFAVLERLALVLYSSKHFQESVAVGERALSLEPKESTRQIYLTLGRSLLENQDHEEAFHVFQRGIELFEKRPKTTTEGKALYLNLKAESCRALFLLGRHPEAGAAINDLMTSANAYGADPQSNVAALLMYAEIAAQYDKIPEALQAALKAVASDQTNKRAKKLLATVLSHPTGLDELYKQVPPTTTSPSAYAFVAMAIKDHSALGPAERLLKKIVEIERANFARKTAAAGSAAGSDIHNYVLNLVHVLETAAQPLPALSEIASHLKFLVKSAVGGSLGLHEILEEVESAIALVAVSSQTRSPTLFFPPILSTGSPPLRVLWYRDPATREETPHLVPVDSDQDVIPVADPVLSVAPPLDLLAVLFTAVKILFVQGNLASVTRLVDKIELLRRSYQTSTRTALHETTIRNEHAYYLCLCQVLSVAQQRPSLATFPYYESFYFNASLRPIFLCGDSHCLSAAWSQISIPTDLSDPQSPLQPRLLIPKLVTGLKQWHLRPGSDFYPKEGFQRAMASLPEGSDVILLVGEIDCREGLLVAVERGVYSSLEEAMAETLKVFRATVSQLIHKKKFRVFIHPVSPVLDVTRQIVALFNFHFRQTVRDLPGCHWLDFFDSLLETEAEGGSDSGSGVRLRESWKLDGTHLSPAYASLLETAFRSLASSSP